MIFSRKDQERLMGLVMSQVELSIEHGDEPFGVVLVNARGEVVASARNTANSERNMLAHAEMNLIKKVYAERGRGGFVGCAAFMNAASCCMCASAMIRAGVADIYYGASFESHTNPRLSYEQLAPYAKQQITVHKGILEDECLEQIKRGRKSEVKPKIYGG